MNQLQFFNLSVEEESFPVAYIPNFLTTAQADQLFADSKTLAWQQNKIRMLGKLITLPRQEVMYGDAGCQYVYSNSVKLVALPWIEQLLALLMKVEAATGYSYQVAIGNYYQTGCDYIGWHSDDEASMGTAPAIASVSLGAARKFQLRKKGLGTTIHDYWLEHGSLLLMQPGIMSNYIHQLPKSRVLFPRINFTRSPVSKVGTLVLGKICVA